MLVSQRSYSRCGLYHVGTCICRRSLNVTWHYMIISPTLGRGKSMWFCPEYKHLHGRPAFLMVWEWWQCVPLLPLSPQEQDLCSSKNLNQIKALLWRGTLWHCAEFVSTSTHNYFALWEMVRHAFPRDFLNLMSNGGQTSLKNSLSTANDLWYAATEGGQGHFWQPFSNSFELGLPSKVFLLASYQQLASLAWIFIEYPLTQPVMMLTAGYLRVCGFIL